MYKIIKAGEEIGMVEQPLYIYINPRNGCYNRATEATAEGIAFNSTPYNISTKEPMNPELETVDIVEVDGGTEIHNTATITQEQYEILTGALMELADIVAENEASIASLEESGEV